MQFLDEHSSTAWLNARCPGAWQLEHSPKASQVRFNVEFWPANHLRSVAQLAMRWLFERDSSRGLLLVRDHGVSPSLENAYLYALIRRDSLNTQTVWETPGHLFERYELPAAESVAFLSLCFGWGFVVAADGSGCLVTADNDWNIRFLSDEPTDLLDIKRWIEQRPSADGPARPTP